MAIYLTHYSRCYSGDVCGCNENCDRCPVRRCDATYISQSNKAQLEPNWESGEYIVSLEDRFINVEYFDVAKLVFLQLCDGKTELFERMLNEQLERNAAWEAAFRATNM